MSASLSESADIDSVDGGLERHGSRAVLRALVGSSIWTMAARQAGNLVAMGYTVLLARWLGADGYGVYNAVLAAGALGALVVGGGIPTLLIRRLAASHAVPGEASPLVPMAYGLARASVVVAALLVVVVVATVCLLLPTPAGPDALHVGRREVLLAGAMVVPLYLLNVHQSMLLAVNWHALASVVGFLARPLLFCVLLAGCVLFGGADSVTLVLGLQVVAVTLAGLLGAALVRRALPLAGQRVPRARNLKAAYQEALPFVFSRLGRALWGRTEVFWLLAFASPDAAGHYAVGLLFSSALANVPDVQSRTLAPLAARSDSPLARVVPQFTRRCCLLVAPVVLLLWLAGDVFLGWFGESYAGALPIVLLLATTQLLTLAFGPAVTVLGMRHQQSMVARSALVGGGVLIVAVAVLGSLYGALGCAVAHLTVSVGWAAWLWWQLRRIEGLRVDVFA